MSERDIVRRDALAERERIDVTTGGVIIDRVDAIAGIEHIDIVAGPAAQRIVADSPDKKIISCPSGDRVIAVECLDHIGIRARSDHIVRCRPVEEPARCWEQAGERYRGVVRKAQRRYANAAVQIIQVEIVQLDRIPPTADLNRESVLQLILREGEIGEGDAGAEDNGVPCARQHRVGDDIVPVAEVEDVQVVPSPAIENVVPSSPCQLIVPIVAKNRVGSCLTEEEIGPGIASQEIISVPTLQLIISIIAGEGIGPVFPEQHVVADPAEETVVADAAYELIVTVSAIKQIVAASRTDYGLIIRGVAEQGIVAAAAEHHVCAIAAV